MKKIVILKGTRRYRTDEQIVAKIDDCYTRAASLRVDAEKYDREADELIRKAWGKGEHEEELAAKHARTMRHEADQLRTKATRLVEVRAKNLGERLSALRTHLLPNTGITDTSVPAL